MDMTYKKILVPHDGSAKADLALEHAISIAKATGGKLILLNVVEEVFIPQAVTDLGYSKTTGERLTAATLAKEIYHQQRSEAGTILNKRKEKYDKNGSLIELRIVMGYPLKKIPDFIQENNIDLVVMGTTGLHGVSKVSAIGSLARRVSELSVSPVILVQ